ncbi:PAS/PAC sensor signal transduction histidine kinase [Salinarchaeum sp. Harcht-Bsk1]|uniref:sensor histidine kinase n=1 Tax=Salinarchaeum sp. Harcht-Bsk1 TaxID=1333523 RepID=UPI00034240FF|nr:PAS domain-containing sensor histidine kinase [Salinarchaeum sp. Harcht-Bsk1]AGN00903.1 PAS/PAC sensor signal transduction histidine kinase [Salinarchaeum sp. Harcht-Bsk1]
MDEGTYRVLVEELPDIATIADPDGRITYVSPTVERTLGYEPDELLGEVGYEFQHPDDREAVAAAFERLLESPDTVETVETRWRHADGTWCWIEASLQNRLDDDVIDGILINSREISRRKRREEQYRELAEEYRTLLDNAEDAIFFLSVDTDGSEVAFRFERLSPSYEAQTGLTTSETRGKTPVEVFGDEAGAELAANYERCVEAREPISYQEELYVEEGARFWQTNLAPVLTNGEVTRIVGITRNVTDRVERERQLRAKTKQLDQFASVVAHDLRNPLNVAQGRAALLGEEFDSEHVEPLLGALDRMESLIEDTLTLSRQGQVVADPEPVELVDVVGSSWQSVATEDATLEIVAGGTISGDANRLQHVFENLFRNAIEHGDADCTIRVGRIDDTEFYVEDDGPGIPDDRKDTVFEWGTSSAADGSGIGLTIVERIAEAHGWTVDVVDAADGGARFEFSGVAIE